MTLEEQIQETIVKYLDDYRPDHKDCECSNCLYFIHELKKELIALIANQVREARIDELKRFDRSSEEMTKLIPLKIGERLYELTKQEEQ